MYDISKFFGLRVINEGFFPYIIKQGEGSKTIWYILSQELNRPKLIKLWQNGTEHIKGSLNLSYQLASEIQKRGDIFAFTKEDEGGIRFLIANSSLEEANINYQPLVFKDGGFDNSQIRQIMSKNINTKNYLVYRASIKELGVCLSKDEDISYQTSFPVDNLDIYLGDSMSNFRKAVPKLEIPFSGQNRELFFRLVFYPTPDNIEYSPWLDNINNLVYTASF